MDITWDELNMPHLMVFNAAVMSSIRAVVFPFVLVKTRLQTQNDSKYRGTIDAFLKIRREEGVRSFYKGFGTSFVGALPMHMLYLTTYEFVRAHVPAPDSSYVNPTAFKNFVGGGVASMISASFTVPFEVVSQRLMIQTGTGSSYLGAISVLSNIIRDSGVKGLFRGYVVTLATFVPNSALWWGSYGIIKPFVFSVFDQTTQTKWLAERSGYVIPIALSGAITGATTTLLTNPLDLAKTRIQTSETSKGMLEVFKELKRQEGVISALLRGVSARMAASSMTSTLLITTYELGKQWSAKNKLAES